MRIRGLLACGGAVLVMGLALVGCGASVSNAPADVDKTPVSPVTAPVITKAQSGATFPTGIYRLALSFSSFNVPPPVAAAPREGSQFTLGNTPFNFRRAATPSPLTTVYTPAFEVR